MLRLRLSLDAGQVARLQGPLRCRVVSGLVMVLGAVFRGGDEFEVSMYRSYALKALDDAVVEVEAGPGGLVERPRPGEEPLDEWVYAVDSALRRGCRGFMVLGQVDSGKSSISALVANRALLRGLRVGVVDADVGQADVGPPATVSAAEARGFILWLRELRAERMRFVGYVSPQRAERRIVGGVVDLAHWLRGRGVEVVVVDTDGWVQGVGSLEYKLEAAHLAGLDTVVVVGDEKLYRMVRGAWGGRGCGVLYLRSPAVRRERSRDDRRQLRSEAYRRYLEPMHPRTLSLRGVGVVGSCFFSGDPLPGETAEAFSQVLRVPVEAASETYDTVYVVTRGQADPVGLEKLSQALGKQVYVLDKNNMRGALLALVGPSGVEEALAVLEDIDFRRMEARLRTPYRGEVHAIIAGGTRLGPDLEETGRPLRCVF